MKKGLLVFLAVLLAVPVVFAATYTVCPHLSCDYQTITACFNAINNTADNTCNINESGTYTISGAYTYHFTTPTWGPIDLLTISADNIILNCNGATFIGQDTYERFHITSEPSSRIKDVTIKNCNFRHFWNPINVDGADNPTIINNTFEFCGKLGDTSSVVTVWGTNGGIIESNTFLNNIIPSFWLAYGTNNTIIKNNYMNGGSNGFSLSDVTSNIHIINNTIIGMSGNGISCASITNTKVTIIDNTIKNTYSAIQVLNATVIGNNMDNCSLGILVSGADSVVSDNYITNSIAPLGIGIWLMGGVNKNNNITGNTIINATGYGYGIFVYSDSQGNFISSNIIERMSAAGLLVLSSNNTITSNTFSYNGGAIGITSSGNILWDNVLNYNNNIQLYVPEGVNVTINSLTIGSPIENYYVSKENNTLNLFNSNSAIKWSNSTIDLTGNYGLNLYLGSKFVSLNSANLPELNTKANVTIAGISCSEFKLWHSSGFYNSLADIMANGIIVATQANTGGDCTNTTICKNVQCSANTLTFEAQHFDGFGGEGTGSTSGNVSINLTSEVSIMVKYNIAYGEGRVNPDKPSAVLDSSLTNATNGTWTYGPQYMYVENDGTVNISVNITSSKNASAFIGGTNPELKVKGIVTEADSCKGTFKITPFEIFTTSESICSLFQFGTSFDSFNVSTRLLIPSDAPVGHKESVLTFTAKKV